MVRTPWGVPNEAESRAYLHARLTLLYQLMFWAYALLLSSMVVLYKGGFGVTEPWGQNYIFGIGTIALVLMAALWRGVLLRRALSFEALQVLDSVYSLGSGLALGACAVFAWDYPPSHYITEIYAYIAVFGRTIIVPSSGPRSLVASVMIAAPVAVGGILIAILSDKLFLPGPVFASGGVVLNAVAVLLGTQGSRIIYGLRRQVSAAQQLGSYKLERKIGEGGNGAVYLAHHIMLRRPTAVKLLLPDRVGADNLERFEREVQHMSKLTHPNTVAVFDYGRSPEGLFYYAMEYLGGGIDLENLVRKHGPQPSGRVAQILAQVCGALSEAHDNRLIHRDIKPANIMLCERGGMPDIAKVLDYGLVKEITANGSESTQILGTPAYVAPEAVTDPDRVDRTSDLYALGCVGYFLLTGHRVFEGKTTFDVCMQHVSARPRPPSEVAALHIEPALEAILMKCLQKRPAERFASAHEMAEAIRALPPMRDWDLPDARAWWREFRQREQEALASAHYSTLTITVDLGQRENSPDDVTGYARENRVNRSDHHGQ